MKQENVREVIASETYFLRETSRAGTIIKLYPCLEFVSLTQTFYLHSVTKDFLLRRHEQL